MKVIFGIVIIIVVLGICGYYFLDPLEKGKEVVIERAQEELERLREKNKKLKVASERLQEELEELREKNKKLNKKIYDLKEKIDSDAERILDLITSDGLETRQ